MHVLAFIVFLFGACVFAADAMKAPERRLISVGLCLITVATILQLVVTSGSLIQIH